MWYYSKNGVAAGPHRLREILELLKNKKISRETFVWSTEAKQWQQVGNVLDRKTRYKVIPPPPDSPVYTARNKWFGRLGGALPDSTAFKQFIIGFLICWIVAAAYVVLALVNS